MIGNDNKSILERYLKDLSKKCSEFDLHGKEGELFGQFCDQHDIRPDTTLPLQAFNTAADVASIASMEEGPRFHERRFPEPYQGPLACLMVDDKIGELKGYVEQVPTEIRALMNSYQLDYVEYNGTDDIRTNVLGLEKKIEAHLRGNGRNPLFILLDLNLTGSQASGLELGEAFFAEVRRRWPFIPLFALTRYRDVETIMRVSRLGANGYIYKPSIALLPFLIGLFLQKEFGPVLGLLGSDNWAVAFRQILSWKNMPHVLWFGDKVPVMVDHGLVHSRNLWSLMNGLYEGLGRDPVERKSRLLRIMGDGQNAEENLMAFLLAIWLHDIGHKGDQHYQSPPEVRRFHGAISAGLLSTRPDIYLPHLRHEGPNPGERVERIAAFCRSHVSNSPMDEVVFAKLLADKALEPVHELGNMPLVTRAGRGAMTFSLPLHVCEDPTTGRKYPVVPPDMRPAVSLFRFVDAVDMQRNRVGDVFYLSVKNDGCCREMAYTLRGIRHAAEELEREFLRLHPTCVHELEEIHLTIAQLNDVLEGVLAKEQRLEALRSRSHAETGLLNHPFVVQGMLSWLDGQKASAEGLMKRVLAAIPTLGHDLSDALWNWRNLTEYMILLFTQQKHFVLHQTFREVAFRPGAPDGNGRQAIQVGYVLDRPCPPKREAKLLYAIEISRICTYAWEYVKKEWASTGRYLMEAGMICSHVVFDLGPAGAETLRFPVDGEPRRKEGDGSEGVYEAILTSLGFKDGIQVLGRIRISFAKPPRKGGSPGPAPLFIGARAGTGEDLIKGLEQAMEQAFESILDGMAIQEADEEGLWAIRLTVATKRT